MGVDQSNTVAPAPGPIALPWWMERDLPLGSRENSMFPQSETLGIIEGIKKVGDDYPISMDDLSSFHYLPEGAEIVFESPRTISVLVLGIACDSEQREYDELYSYKIEVKEGSRIKGPIAWHASGPMEQDTLADEPTFVKLMLVLIATISIMFAIFPPPLLIIVLLMAACVFLYWVCEGGTNWMALRTMEKTGRAEIIGTADQYWD